jgi:HK97 family phage major capsid protein
VALIDQLREQRAAVRTAGDTILTRAASESRDLTAEELADHGARTVEARELDDRIEALLADQVAELRAAQIRQPNRDVPADPILSREQSVHDWLQARGAFDGYQVDQPLSFDRYLRGLATARWDGAEHERALAEATVGAGGALVPSPLSSRVIDLARNQSRVFQAGAVTVPMTSQTLAIPRLLTEGSPAWKTEGASITAADMTFDRVTFTARTLVRLVQLSVELFEDADPSSEGIIARSFAAQMALELDRVALLGSGTAPEPRGVLNQSGITTTSHGANGANITNYDWFLDAKGAVLANNFDPNAHIVAPRTVTSLGKLKEATTNAYMAAPAGMLPILATKQLPITLTVGTSTDASYVFTAQWDQLLVGVRTDFNLRFLGERYLADSLTYAFLAYLRADVQLAQPAAFVVDTGVKG